MIWSVEQVAWHRQQDVRELLDDGWEPFAVTEDELGATLWLRRTSPTTADADDVEPSTVQPDGS